MTQEKKVEKVLLKSAVKLPDPIPSNPTQGAEPIKDDDLLIVDEQGGFCRVQRATYLNHEIKGDSPELKKLLSEMSFLANQGVVLADLPQGALRDVDCACYLVNLAGIRGPASNLNNNGKKT